MGRVFCPFAARFVVVLSAVPPVFCSARMLVDAGVRKPGRRAKLYRRGPRVNNRGPPPAQRYKRAGRFNAPGVPAGRNRRTWAKTQPQAMWMPILPQLLAGGRMPPRGAPWSTNAALVSRGVHLGMVRTPKTVEDGPGGVFLMADALILLLDD